MTPSYLKVDAIHITVSLLILRLRASIFVNLVAMRSAVGKGRNDWCVLKPQNLSLLQRANFLLHSALNSNLAVLTNLLNNLKFRVTFNDMIPDD